VPGVSAAHAILIMMAADDQSLVHQRRIAAFEQTAYVVSGSGMGKKGSGGGK
jgi:hypothetical protein